MKSAPLTCIALALLGATAVCSRAGEFVRVEPGSFSMGAVPGPDVLKPGHAVRYSGPHWDETPVHEVRISRPFQIARSVVTMGEFARFKPEYRALAETRGVEWNPNAPAVMVTWDEAADYCRWLSEKEGKPYRLPTEAEWEYAAPKLERHIQEWCLDWWAPYSPSAEVDPLGPCSGIVHVIRGNGDRMTNRSGSIPGDRRPFVGFRVVQAPMPKGTHRADSPADAVFQNVSQQRKVWKPQSQPDVPCFAASAVHITKPSEPLTLPYWGRHHVPSVAWCDNGDLLVTAFTAPADNSDQMAILITRLRDGKTVWDPPARFFIAPDRNVTSATLFNDGKGELHHYNGLAGAKCDHFSMIKRVSRDNGATWSAPRIVHEYPVKPASMETFTGEPRLWPHMDMVRLDGGSLVMPSDVGGGHDRGTVLFESRDNGESWRERTRFGWKPEGFARKGGQAGWIAGIHAPFVCLDDGRYLAFGRTNDIEERSPFSLSSDGGKTWTYQPSPFPRISSGQRPILLRLQEGPLLLVSFTDFGGSKNGIEITDVNGQCRRVCGMFTALSFDEGRTWSHIRLVPQDPLKPDVAEGGGYLSCVQTPDLMIHLVSSRRYYRFNLAWLKQPIRTSESNRNVKTNDGSKEAP